MRFYFFSLIIHGLALALAFGLVSPRLNSSVTKPSLEVEIISFPVSDKPPVSITQAPAKPSVPTKKIRRRKPLAQNRTKKFRPSADSAQLPHVEELVSESSSPSKVAQAARLTYAQQLKGFIERNKFYPRSALRLKHSGTVKIHLEIAPDGQFTAVHLAENCPHDSLNKAALSLIKRLKRFKPLPPEFVTSKNFVIPIAYQIRRGG